MDLVRLRAIARKEWIQLRRNTRSMILAFVLPLFLLLFFGYAITWDVNDIPVAVLDQDRTPESRSLVEALQSSGYFTVTEYLESSSAIDARLVGDDVLGVVWIPRGFARDLAAPARPATAATTPTCAPPTPATWGCARTPTSRITRAAPAASAASPAAAARRCVAAPAGSATAAPAAWTPAAARAASTARR